MNAVLIHTCAPGGSAILAQADGSSGPELFRTISSSTVTDWPLVIRVTTSLLSLAWPRTLTLLATTIAGPATSGVVLSSGSACGFLTAGFFATAGFSDFLTACLSDFFSDFFLPDFFLPALAAGALV